MVMNYFRLLAAVLSLPDRIGVAPRHIQMDVTTRCNLRCKMCARDQFIPKDEYDVALKLEDFRKIVDAIRPMSINMIAGGEPFLNPQIFDMIEYAAEKDIQTIVSSNFVLGKAVVEKVAASRLDVLKISIDGAVKETYEKVRGPHFDQLVENIRHFNACKASLKKKGPGLRFDLVIQGDTYREIEQYFDFARSLSAESVYFHPIDCRGFSEQQVRDIVRSVDLEELKALLQRADRKAKQMGIASNAGVLYRKFDLVRSLFLQEDVVLKRRPCLLPWMHMFVSIAGETSPCCSIYPAKSSYGNVLKQPFEEIWNGEKCAKDRALFRSRKNYPAYESCRHCLPMELGTLFEAAKTFPRYIGKAVRQALR